MSDGEWQFAAVSDNGPTLEPYFNETWAVSPSLLPRKKQVKLRELAVSSVKALKCVPKASLCEALGFQDGIFHVELKYTTQHGPQLIEAAIQEVDSASFCEVNARMGRSAYENHMKIMKEIDDKQHHSAEAEVLSTPPTYELGAWIWSKRLSSALPAFPHDRWCPGGAKLRGVGSV